MLGKEINEREKVMSTHLSSTVTNGYIRNYLDKSSSNYQDCLEKLSSGNRFTSVGTDPVDSAKSDALSVEISFNSQIQSNIATGKDLIASAGSYQESILDNVQRIQELTTQAANGTYSSDDKDAILTEIRSRIAFINDTVKTANFNGKNLLDGSSTSLSFKTGIGISDNVNVGSALINMSTTALGIDIPATTTGANWTSDQIGTYITNLTTATGTLTSNIAKLGAYENRMDYTNDKLVDMEENLTEYRSKISDTDTAEASADLVRYQILQQAATSIFVQANEIGQLKYSLFSSSS